jgi:putative ABC transport system ATP-binding protein
MMNMVGALDIPTRGAIYLDGKDISKLHESDLAAIRGKKIGFVFQQFNLIPTLTAIENVMLPMEFQNAKNPEDAALKVLETVGLGDRINHKPQELSGGQQQRVAIARALANNPEVVLADEPTGNLDSKTGREIMELFKNLNKSGKTVILITHDLNLVKYGERVIKLGDGKVIRGEK